MEHWHDLAYLAGNDCSSTRSGHPSLLDLALRLFHILHAHQRLCVGLREGLVRGMLLFVSVVGSA